MSHTPAARQRPAAVPQQPGGSLRLRRRDLGLAMAGTAAAATLPAVLAGQPAAADPAADSGASDHLTTILLATVGSVQTGGLLNQLLASFQAQSPYQVELFVGQVDLLYQRARDGLADLVISHFGTQPLQDLVADRIGRWPQLWVNTSFTLIAASDDPAGIRQAGDAVEAFGRIAQTASPFVVNNLNNPLAVTDVLWNAAGRPDQAGWFLDTGLSGPAAVREAERLGGYTLWGLHPFLAFRQQEPTTMQATLYDDSLLQRVVSSVAVEPGRYRRVNLPGALALQEFLIAPPTQGQIRQFRHPMVPGRPIFWPATHHNDHGE